MQTAPRARSSFASIGFTAIGVASLLFLLATGGGFSLSEALAEDAPTATALSPAQRFLQTVMKFEDPADSAAFDVKGVILIGEQEIGTFDIKATPMVRHETSLWSIEENISIQGGAMTRAHKGVLRSDLLPLEGTHKEKDPSGIKERSYKLTDKGMRVTLKGAAGEDVVRLEAAADGFTTGIASLLLFGRMGTPKDGKAGADLEVRLLHVDAAADEPMFDKAKLLLVGPGTWSGKGAYIIKAIKPDSAIEVAFDLKTRAPLGLRMSGDDQPIVQFEIRSGKAEIEESTSEAGFLRQPAQSAKHAALQAAYAFATADLKLLESLAHWPSTYEQVSDAEKKETLPNVEAWRTQVMAQLKATLKPKVDPKMLKGVLASIESQLVETPLPNGWVRVQFPPVFKSLQIVVGKFDDGWRLTQFPEGS